MNPTMQKAKRSRPTRLAFIAACACLLALLTAFAASSADAVGEPPFVETDEIHGYVGATSAQFRATVNVRNFPTTYHFEYGSAGPCDANPCQQTSTQGPVEGNEFQNLTGEANGLAPQTTYHYRVVLDTSSEGEVKGSEQTLTTTTPEAPEGPCPNEAIRIEQHATDLPQCMAYELISPVDTDGIDIQSGTGFSDSSHAWFASVLPVSDSQQTGNGDLFAAIRTDHGWVSHDLAEPPPSDHSSPGYVFEGRSADGSTSLLQRCSRNSVVGCGGDMSIERVAVSGDRQKLLTVTGHKQIGEGNLVVEGAARDLSTVVVGTGACCGGPPTHLLPVDTRSAGEGLYAAGDGGLEYLGVDEAGHAFPCGAELGVGSPLGYRQTGLSADGRVAVISTPDKGVTRGKREELGCPLVTELYVRHDGQSIDISAPPSGDPHPDLGATFAGMSQDGDAVYFVTKTQLLADDDEDTADLYRYDVPAARLERLTNGAEINEELVLHSVIVSPEGDYVYFTSSRSFEGHANLGGVDLFVYHADTITRILASARVFLKPRLGMRLTPDGKQLLFESDAAAVGPPTGGHKQIFAFNAAAQSLICISCHPDGTIPTTDTEIHDSPFPLRSADQRLQSGDGELVPFETAEQLLPADTNSSFDLYLWDRGRLFLVTNPAGSPHLRQGFFGGTTASGDAVYFQDKSQLTPDAGIGTQKLYVLRSGGGVVSPSLPPDCGTPSECRAPGSAESPGSASGSSSFVGPPNPPPRHIRKRRHHVKKHRRHRHPNHRQKRPHRSDATNPHKGNAR